MRFAILLTALAMLAIAQEKGDSPAGRDQSLNLRGDRFPPLKWADMTQDQRAMAERALKSKKAGGPFAITLRSPEMANAMRSNARAQTSLAPKLMELAIVLNARFWTSQFEFSAHHRAAVRAGVKEETVKAIAEGRKPTAMDPDEQVVYDYLCEILNTKQVRDATFDALRARIGERGIVDLINITGSYIVGSLQMNADRYPMGPNEQPELKPMDRPLP
jgi:4-carboxymuconolactone decarboxylase